MVLQVLLSLLADPESNLPISSAQICYRHFFLQDRQHGGLLQELQELCWRRLRRAKRRPKQAKRLGATGDRGVLLELVQWSEEQFGKTFGDTKG